MRKVSLNSLLAVPTESLLSSFTAQRLTTQISDARLNAALHGYKVGHPQGMVDVPNKRGWIYMQRMLPDGNSITEECFVPTNADGKTRVKFKAGMPIAPRRTSDTQPTYFTYDGIPPPTKVIQCSCDTSCGSVAQCGYSGSYGGAGTSGVNTTVYRLAYVSRLSEPCDDVAGCSYRTHSVCVPANSSPTDIPGFQSWGGTGSSATCNGSGGSDGTIASTTTCNVVPGQNPADQNYDYYSGNGPGGSLPPSFPTGSTDPSNGSDGFNDTNSLVTPIFSPTPPIVPALGELWYDGLFTRRYNGSGPTGWAIMSGPTPGVYSEYKTGEALEPYRVVYKDSTDHTVHQAVATDPAAANHIVGISLIPSETSGRITVVQQSGILSYPNGFAPGTNLWLGDDGRLSTTAPDVGSGKLLQLMGVVNNSHEVQLTIGPSILRVS